MLVASARLAGRPALYSADRIAKATNCRRLWTGCRKHRNCPAGSTSSAAALSSAIVPSAVPTAPAGTAPASFTGPSNTALPRRPATRIPCPLHAPSSCALTERVEPRQNARPPHLPIVVALVPPARASLVESPAPTRVTVNHMLLAAIAGSAPSCRRCVLMSRIFQNPWYLLISAFAAFAGFVLLQYSVPIIDYQLNADSMYVFTITKDMIFDGGRLSDWFTSVHLFIYPDMLLALPVLVMHKLGLPVFLGCIALYGLLLLLLIACAWRKITAEPLALSLLAGSVLLGIAFCGDCVLYKLLSQQPQTPDLLKALKHTYAAGHVLGPALHSGAFILAFVLFYPLHDVLAGAQKPSLNALVLLGWLSCNVFLVTLSDLMFVAWGIIPLSVVVLSRIARTPWRTSGLLIAALWVSGILGYVVSRLTSLESTYVGATGRPLIESVQGLVDFALLAGSMKRPVMTFFLCTNILMWVAGIYFSLREFSSSASNVGRSLTILAGSMSVASVLAPVAAGLFTGGQMRYFIPYFVLGPMFCAFLILLAALRFISSASWAACATAGAFMILAVGLLGSQILPGSTARRLSQCLEADGLVSGRADFWDAAPVVVASGWRVHVAPLAPGTLSLYPWLTKKQWLQNTSDGDVSGGNFLILHPDLTQEAAARYGPADRTFSCAGRRILVYRRPFVERADADLGDGGRQ